MSPIRSPLHLRCRLNKGERAIPLYNVVILGKSTVNESILTGEIVPAPKHVYYFVYGGTVTGSGRKVNQCTAFGDDVVLSQIMKIVKDARTNRAISEAFADLVSAIFSHTVDMISEFAFEGRQDSW